MTVEKRKNKNCFCELLLHSNQAIIWMAIFYFFKKTRCVLFYITPFGVSKAVYVNRAEIRKTKTVQKRIKSAAIKKCVKTVYVYTEVLKLKLANFKNTNKSNICNLGLKFSKEISTSSISENLDILIKKNV